MSAIVPQEAINNVIIFFFLFSKELYGHVMVQMLI